MIDGVINGRSLYEWLHVGLGAGPKGPAKKNNYWFILLGKGFPVYDATHFITFEYT